MQITSKSQMKRICCQTGRGDWMDWHKITIPYKEVSLKFNKCSHFYNNNICKAACCRDENLMEVPTLSDEWAYLWKRMKKDNLRGTIERNMITSSHVCSFFKNNFCSLHNTKHKPFGCRMSPFTVHNDKLIVRSKYKKLICCTSKGEPAYEVFQSSLEALFGDSYRGIIENLSFGKDIEVLIEKRILSQIDDINSLRLKRDGSL